MILVPQVDRNHRSATPRRWPLSWVLLLSCLLASPAAGQLCLNTARYFDLTDDGTSYPFCHAGIMTCETPVLGASQYTAEPGCDPLRESCAVTVEIDVEFPGNHQNDPLVVGLGYSFGTLQLTDGGNVIDACGVAGATIRRDHGRFEYTRSVTCLEAASLQLELEASMCPCAPNVPVCSWQSCEKKATVSIDLGAGLGEECRTPPPPQGCGEGECVSCIGPGSGGGSGPGSGGGGPGGGGSGGGGPGGGGAGGGGPGGGGPPPPPGKGGGCSSGASVGGGGAAVCPPDSGSGATLRYLAGGAGHPGFPGSTDWNPILGRYWSHDAAERIIEDPDAGHVWLITRFANFKEFTDADGDGLYETVAPSDEYRRLSKTAAGWELRSLDGTVQSFDTRGRWSRTEDRNGNASVTSYIGMSISEVSFPDGRSESFSYHVDGKLATMTEVGVDGATTRTWSYAWIGNDLSRIDRPDGTAWEFRYDDPDFPGYMTRMSLVGIDGSRRVEGAWEYDDFGNTVKTWKGSSDAASPQAVDLWILSFDSPILPRQTLVTDPLGNVATYTVGYDPASIKPRVFEIEGDCPACGVGPNARLFYDDPAHPLRPTRYVDAKNVETRYEYEEHGMRISMTEAVGTALERTTEWEYDATYPLLINAVERPSTSGSGVRRAALKRDQAGNATLLTETGFEAGDAFSLETVTSYNSAGLPEVIDPPGYGTSDRTVFTYDPVRGDMLPVTRTDPLVGTSVLDYDDFNRVTRGTDPNGVALETTYDELDRPLVVTQKGAASAGDLVTTHSYTVFGDLLRTVHPEGNVTEYGYDAAGRLISVEHKPAAATPSERVLMTLNAAGQRTREERQSWNGSGWQTELSNEFIFTSRCQLDRAIQGDGSVTEFAYECNGNLEKIWDGNHPSGGQQNPPTRSFEYDELFRVIAVSRPWGGAGGGSLVTRYEYDIQDHLVATVDGNGSRTRYVYSDRDLQTESFSETAGTTRWSYNEHGEIIRETDARGISAVLTVDQLDRVVFADFANDRLDTSYIYEDAAVPFSKGRLTAIVRDGRAIDYRWDRFGRMIRDGELSYAYDRNGNRRQIVYPGGLVATYSHDFADREASLTIQHGTAAPQSLVAAASYRPSGPVASLLLGNGLSENRFHDARYLPAGLEVPGRLQWSYVTDGLGNVTSITDGLDPTGNRTFAYQDYQDYLIAGDGPWGQRAWTYDRLGNRLSETRDGATATYAYQPNAAGARSSKLASSVSSAISRSYGYDAAGNLIYETGDQSKTTYHYDHERRLARIRSDSAGGPGKVVELSYDGRGYLSRATSTSQIGLPLESSIESTYSSAGRLLHRTTIHYASLSSPRDTPRVNGEDYVFYFSGRPVALLAERTMTPPTRPTEFTRDLIYLTTDHLGTPVLATDESGATIWQGGFESFGEDFSGAQDAGIFLRFLGQWSDDTWARASPSGTFHYNVHRWYHAGTGRYMREDPLTLAGGHINLYLYVANDPINAIDPYGLFGLADIPAPPKEFGEVSAGLGDALLFSYGDELRDHFGIGGIDRCSDWYRAGNWASLLVGSGRLVYAGAAKGLNLFRRASNLSRARTAYLMSTGRNMIKRVFRFGLFPNYRIHPWPTVVAKYRGDYGAIMSAAQRTNPAVNAAGAHAASGALVNRADCDCP